MRRTVAITVGKGGDSLYDSRVAGGGGIGVVTELKEQFLQEDMSEETVERIGVDSSVGGGWSGRAAHEKGAVACGGGRGWVWGGWKRRGEEGWGVGALGSFCWHHV